MLGFSDHGLPRCDPALRDVFEEWHRQGVSYCYWKSTRRLEGALLGRSDCDLLIARDDQMSAERILLEHDFKFFPTAACKFYPGVRDFLRLGDVPGALIHLHLHYQLVTGDRLLRNYHLPWEDVLLAHGVLDSTLPVRILDPASEALLLIARACLELGWFDPLTLWSFRATAQKFEDDRHALARRVSRSALQQRAARVFDDAMAETMVEAFFADRPITRNRRLRRRLRRAVAHHRSYGGPEAILRRTGRTVLWLAGGLNKRYLHRPWPLSRRVASGGIIVAVLGADGSGKSTLVSGLVTWLRQKMDVLPIYMGSGVGRPSLLRLPLFLLSSGATRLFKRSSHQGTAHRSGLAKSGVLYGILLTIWALTLAVEKRQKLIAARRAANRGMVVVADRYPQNEITGFNDGPLLPRLSKVPEFLLRFEASCYALARALPPDLVVKLDIDLETAAARKDKMAPEEIQRRIDAVRSLSFPSSRVVHVDATRPAAEVALAVKREIWRLL